MKDIRRFWGWSIFSKKMTKDNYCQWACCKNGSVFQRNRLWTVLLQILEKEAPRMFQRLAGIYHYWREGWSGDIQWKSTQVAPRFFITWKKVIAKRVRKSGFLEQQQKLSRVTSKDCQHRRNHIWQHCSYLLDNSWKILYWWLGGGLRGWGYVGRSYLGGICHGGRGISWRGARFSSIIFKKQWANKHEDFFQLKVRSTIKT